MAATARLNLARLMRSAGNGTAAVSLLRENVEWYASAGGGDGALLSRCVLAAETDDTDSLEVVLTEARADQNHLVIILALDGLARLSAAQGETDHAADLLAQADALHPAAAHVLDSADRIDRTALLATSAHLVAPVAIA
jgi:hypothetical protein